MSDSPYPEPFTDFDPQHAAALALIHLIRPKPAALTYTQIEDAMLKHGLDPFDYSAQYEWILQALDAQKIAVVDTIDEPIEDAEEYAVLEESDEMRAILNRIIGQANREYQHLPANEQRRLLELVALGKQATAELERATSEMQRFQLQRQVNIAGEAFNKLVETNVRLVAHVALKHAYKAKHLEVDDLIQEGMIGLTTAIQKFDLEQTTNLSTYAVWWIRQAITRAIADKDRAIRLPVHRSEERNAYRRALTELTIELERTPTDLELAAELNLLTEQGIDAEIRAYLLAGEPPEEYGVEDKIAAVLRHIQILHQIELTDPLSLDMPLSEGESTLGDLIPASDANSVENAYFAKELVYELKNALEALNNRTRSVIERRFGCNGHPSQTLQEIGDDIGITRERVRQIEANGLRQLRNPMRTRTLRAFVD